MTGVRTSVRLSIALVALMAVAAIAAGCSQRVVSSDSPATINTVTASGHGEVSASPDEATMSFGVVKRDADAKKALDAASGAADRIAKTLKAQGVDAKDIQTTGVNVYPQYSEHAGKTAITGFEASINVTVNVSDLGRLGAIIAALSDAGADSMSGPSFGISEDTTWRAEAIRKAVADARKQAQEMADAAGKSLGDVVSITNSTVSVPQPFAYGARAEAMDVTGAVPIEPGRLDVTADVTVVFELR